MEEVLAVLLQKRKNWLFGGEFSQAEGEDSGGRRPAYDRPSILTSQ